MTKKANNLLIVIVLIAIIVTGVVIAVVLSGNSREYTYKDGDFTFVRKGNTVTLTNYSGDASEVKVVDEVDGFKVTNIGKRVFADRTELKKVTLPDSVTVIEDEAFSGSKNLTSVRMKNVVSIGEQAFQGCSSLDNVIINESLKSIGARAFYDCITLDHLVYTFDEKGIVKSSLESIGSYAFKGSSLDEAVIPASMKRIGDYAFADADIRDIFFYEGVEEIGNYAFRFNEKASVNTNVYTFNYSKDTTGIEFDMDELRNFSDQYTLPSSLKKIGDGAFLKEGTNGSGGVYFAELKVPQGVESIGERAFEGGYISSLKFENPDISLGRFAFANLRQSATLKVALPANIKNIPEGLFLGTRLSSNTSDKIRLPKSVESIGLGAFSGSTTNATIEIDPESPANDKYKFLATGDFRGLLSKDGTVLYSVIMTSSSSTVKIPSTVRIIESYAFMNFTLSSGQGSDNQVVIPVGVREIKEYALSDSGIKYYSLAHENASMITIDDHAFDAKYDSLKDSSKPYKITLKVINGSDLYDKLREQFGTDNEYVSINTYYN